MGDICLEIDIVILTYHCFLNVLAIKIEPMHCLAYYHYHFVAVHSVDNCCSTPRSFELGPFATFVAVVAAAAPTVQHNRGFVAAVDCFD